MMIQISKATNKRVNPTAIYKDAEGTTYPQMPAHLYTAIPDDPLPEGYVQEEYTIREDWETSQRPYTIYTRKPQEVIDRERQERTNIESRAYLLSTDWYAARFAETGVAIPDNVKTKRQAARDAIVELPEVLPV